MTVLYFCLFSQPPVDGHFLFQWAFWTITLCTHPWWSIAGGRGVLPYVASEGQRAAQARRLPRRLWALPAERQPGKGRRRRRERGSAWFPSLPAVTLGLPGLWAREDHKDPQHWGPRAFQARVCVSHTEASSVMAPGPLHWAMLLNALSFLFLTSVLLWNE